VVSVAPALERMFADLCVAHQVPAARIGVTDRLDATLEVRDRFRISLRELRSAWTRTLPDRFESHA
jgi:hypothetical protein